MIKLKQNFKPFVQAIPIPVPIPRLEPLEKEFKNIQDLDIIVPYIK